MFCHTAVKYGIYLIFIHPFFHLFNQLLLCNILNIHDSILGSGTNTDRILNQFQSGIFDSSPDKRCRCTDAFIKTIPRTTHSTLGRTFFHSTYRQLLGRHNKRLVCIRYKYRCVSFQYGKHHIFKVIFCLYIRRLCLK